MPNGDENNSPPTTPDQPPASPFTAQDEAEMKKMPDTELVPFIHDYLNVMINQGAPIPQYVSPSGDKQFEEKVNKIMDDRLKDINLNPDVATQDVYGHPKVVPNAPSPDGNNIAKAADPVNLFDGNFHYSSTDFVINGAGMDCAFIRTYSNQSFYNGPMGNKWDHSYNLWLRVTGDQNIIYRSNGGLAETTYRRHNVHGYWLAQSGDDGIINETSNGFTWKDPSGTEFEYLPLLSARQDIFLIQSITDRFGNFLRFEYEDGLLEKIFVNHQGRTVSFEYDTLNRIIAATDFTGRKWQYKYDDLDDLVMVITPGTEEFRSGVHTCYEYNTAYVSDQRIQHNLVTIIDAEGMIYLENEYGDNPNMLSYNRVTRQRQGGGLTLFEYEDVVETFEFPYPSHQRPAFQTILTQRNGQQVRYLFNRFGNPVFTEEYARINGVPRLVGTHYRYNKDGNLIGTISPSGTITQFLYGRDYYERLKNINEDYVDIEDDDLDIKTRQSFNHLLASVMRGRYHVLASLNFTNGLWGDIFPDIFSTGDEDIIRKITYENDFGQIVTVSDPRHTASADPAFTEAQAYHDHLTEYVYSPGNGSAFHLLSAVQSPTVHLPDGTTAPPASLRLTAYDSNGRLLEAINAEGVQSRLGYFGNSDGVLEGFLKEVEMDPGGLSIRNGVKRDPLGRVVSVLLPKSFDVSDGRFVEKNEYDDLGRIVKQTSSAPFNFNAVRQYNRVGNVKKQMIDRKKSDNTPETDPFLTTTYKYDEEFNVRKSTMGGEDINTHKQFRNLYDIAGRLSFSISPSGIKSKVLYNERSLASKKIADVGGVAATTASFFDADGRIIRVKDAVGAEYRFTYDAFDRLTNMEDALGNKKYLTYDKLGNVVTERFFEKVDDTSYKLLSRSEHLFDELGRKIQSAANKFEGEFIVTGDPSNQFVQTGPGELLAVQIFYDNVGRIVKMVDQVGRVYQTEYDNAGRHVRGIDPLGNEKIQQYDKHDNVTRIDIRETILDAGNNVTGHRCFATSFVYDELDRLIEQTDTLGNKTRYEYNSQGQVTKIVDPLLNTAETEYDIFGRVESARHLLKQPPAADDPVTINYAYDKDDFLLQHVDALGRVTKYQRDSLGRLISTTLPDGSTDRTVYDRASQVIAYTDNNGVIRNVQYDIMGRMSRMDVDTTPAVEGSFFAEFRYDGMGRLITAENEFCRYQYVYNSMGWMLEENSGYRSPDNPSNVQGFSVKRNYYDTGTESDLVYPSGREIHYDRDALDRLTSIGQVDRGQNYTGNPAQPNTYNVLNIEYEGSQKSRISRHNQSFTTYKYDFGGRLIEMAHLSASGPLARMQYLYDAAGNVRNKNIVSDEVNQTRVFGYDSLYRLESISVDSPATIVNADLLEPPENVLPALIPDSQSVIDGLLLSPQPATKQFTYDKSGNRITTEENNVVTENYTTNALDQYTTVNTTNFTYAPNGNLIEDNDWIYKYNFRNQLSSLENKSTGKRIEFYYDPSGKKVMETRDGELTSFVYDALNVIEEHKGDELHSSILSEDDIDSVIQLSERNAEFLAYTDLVKSVTYLFNGNTKHNHYEYDEFGNLLSTTLPADPNVYGFTGKRIIKEAGKYEFISRTYDPKTGKFLQRDPAGYVDGTNLYVYTSNSPLSHIDPLGTERKELSGGGGGSGDSSSGGVPSRMDIQGPPVTPRIGTPIPKIDLPQAPPNTDFKAAEARGRANIRRLVPHGPGEQAQHYLKWREGRKTNLDPAITNDPRYMGPLQSRNRLSTGGPFVIDGRTYNNPHKYADRGLYPHYERKLGRWIKLWGTDRVVHVQTGRRVMQDMTGSKGPTPPFIWRPTASGITFNIMNGAFQYAVPFYVEAELGAFFGQHIAYSRGFLAVGDALGFVGSRVLPVAAAFYIGLEIGGWINEKTGWSHSLANRADRNRQIYKDLGLGDTASTILGAPANIPIVSEIGEGIGWGAFKIYQGGSWLGGKMKAGTVHIIERFTSDEYTFAPWEAEWWPW